MLYHTQSLSKNKKLTGINDPNVLQFMTTSMWDHHANLFGGGKIEGGLSEFEDGKISKFFFYRFQNIDFACMILSMTGVILSIFQYDIEFEDSDSIHNKAILWLIFLTTLLLVPATIYRYVQLVELLKKQRFLSEEENIFSSGQLKNLIFELVIILPIPLPFLNGLKFQTFNVPTQSILTYHYNHIFNIYISLRLFIIMRIILSSTTYANHRSFRVCKMYGCESGYWFAIKSLFKKQPIVFVSSLMIASIFLFGYLLRICERPLSILDPTGKMDFSYYWNSFWLIILTMTTVGYGDFYPRTLPARFIIFLVCLWGVFIVSMMVVTLTNTLNLDSIETKSFNFMKKIKKKKDLKEEASFIITIAAKLKILKKAPISQINAHAKIFYIIKFKKHLSNFRFHLRQYKELTEQSETFTEELNMNFDYIRREFSEISKTNKIFNAINKRMADKTGLNLEIMRKEFESSINTKRIKENGRKTPSPNGKSVNKGFSFGQGFPNMERQVSKPIYEVDRLEDIDELGESASLYKDM